MSLVCMLHRCGFSPGIFSFVPQSARCCVGRNHRCFLHLHLHLNSPPKVTCLQLDPSFTSATLPGSFPNHFHTSFTPACHTASSFRWLASIWRYSLPVTCLSIPEWYCHSHECVSPWIVPLLYTCIVEIDPGCFVSDLRKYICQKKEKKRIYHCRYIENVHRTKCQALTITRLTHSLYATKIARIRRYTMLSTICACKDIQHTISAYIKCQDVQHKINLY